MHRFLTLFKILLINNFGISAFRARARQNKASYFKTLGLALLVLVGLAPSIYLYCRILVQGYTIMAAIGQEGAIVSLGIVLTSAMIFFFGIFYVINIFYFAEDAQSLLALPLRAWQVLGARFSVALCYEYLTSSIFLLPPLIIFGIMSKASVLYYIYVLIAFLLVPVLPLSFATLPTVIIMRFANLGRRKDLLKILGGILIIALAVAYQFLFQRSGPNIVDPQALQNLLSDRNGIINLTSRFFPSSKYLTLALIQYKSAAGFLNLLIVIAVTLIALALALFTAEKMYYQGLIGSSEMKTRRKELSEANYKKISKPSSPLLAYFKKELLLLFRTPPYFINCVLANVLLPFIILIPMYFQSHKLKGTIPLQTLISSQAGQKIILAAIVGLVAFLASTSCITATSLSREGKEFYISKFIPMSSREKLLAKFLSGMLLGLIGAVLAVVAVNILLPIGSVLSATSFLLSIVAMIPILTAGLLIDIYNPKLEWENEQKAVKQNINVFYSMGFAILLCGGIIYLEIKFMQSFLTAAVFMLICFGAAAFILYYLLMRYGIEQYNNLEG